MEARGPRVENLTVASFLRPTLGSTAKTAVVGSFDEVVQDGLIRDWAQGIRASDDVSLIVLGDRPEAEMLARIAPLASELGLASPDSADVAILAGGGVLDERIVAEADFRYSRRDVDGPLGGLPRVDSPEAFRSGRRARRQKAVFVVGMHRSGTSAIARLINILGVPLSVPGDLLLPGPDNPEGFWESSFAVSLSETLLERLAIDVFAPAEPVRGWEHQDELAAIRWEARARLAQVFPTPEWVLKDPRSCFTLPFLRVVTDTDAVIVMPYRNPLEVACSLEERNGIPWKQGLGTWESYVRSSLDVTAGLPVSVHAFEDVVENPIAHVERLHGFLRSHGVSVRDIDAPLRREVRKFLKPELRHHRHDAEALRRAATADQLALYDALAMA
jgi:hypothetical protein